jgi:hypothetical protein
MKSIDFSNFDLNKGFKGKVLGKNYKWFNAMNLNLSSGHFWGFGLLQIGRRHLFFIGNVGISILFIGETH